MSVRDVQMVSLDILKDVHNFCVNNNIRYSLGCGTLLGAIRHNGFIPWDDDVDIQMPRPDYNRFIHTYKSSKGYRLLSREMDGNKVYRRLARVCDVERTYVNNDLVPSQEEKIGVAIDIQPIDGAPSDRKEAKNYLRGVKIRLKITNYYRGRYIPWDAIRRLKGFQKAKYALKKILGYMILDSCFERLSVYQQKFDFENSDYFYASITYGMGEWQPKENIKNFILHKFEDSDFYIMSGYDANLHSLYGDYMKLPPENQRKTHTLYKHYWK